MSLAQHIHELTRPHLPAGATIDTPKVPSLLDQLATAVTAETRAGSSGSNEPAIPIGSGALSLHQDIDRQARNEQECINGHRIGVLEAIIQAWATLAEQEWVAYLEHVTLDWRDQIRAIIAPTKPPYRPAVPCPSCGVLYNKDGEGPGLRVHCWGDDEALLPNTGDWSAECIHCGAGWAPGGDMAWLRSSLLSAQNVPAVS